MVSVKLEAGMANQMFQMAFIYAYAKKHGFEYCVPTSVTNSHISGRGAYIFPGINYSNDYVGKLNIFHENSLPNHFNYQELPPMDNTEFYGFFQSYKYFHHYREDILKAFGFDWKLNEGVVSVHVRRDDFLKWPDHHPVITKEYIESAMLMFPGKVFHFFSDDPAWVKENFGEKKDCFDMSTDDEILDLTNMSCCQYNICSNSSMSWWGQYLNKNSKKRVVAPQKNKWFGELLRHNVDDLYMDNWELI